MGLDKRNEIMEALLDDPTIAGIVGNEVHLWMSPNQDVFPRIIVLETDERSERGTDDETYWINKTYAVAFSVKMDQPNDFIKLCSEIPAVLRKFALRHIGSDADNPVPEYKVVTKTQRFQTFVMAEAEEYP